MQPHDIAFGSVAVVLFASAGVGAFLGSLRARARSDEAAAKLIIDRRLAEVVRRVGPEFAFVPPKSDECDPRLSGPGDPGPPAHCKCAYQGPNEWHHDCGVGG